MFGADGASGDVIPTDQEAALTKGRARRGQIREISGRVWI
jgi:hypothetical protein